MANWGKITNRGRVEDRRSFSTAAVGGISLTGVALLFAFNLLTGGSTEDFVRTLEEVAVNNSGSSETSQYQGQDSYEVFASTVLGSNNEVWKTIFSKSGKEYKEPLLVLFRDATDSLCGVATSQVGPHYCPLDETIYLDETFFDELTNRFGARGGDVAEAYVISHEVGHHVQNQLNVISANSDNSNERSIKTELQADCYAGLWANSIKDRDIFEQGEIIEAMDAAAAVGDDRIQSKVTGYVNPESWTHGSSIDRIQWFNRGYESGDISSCNTFEY